MANQGAKHWTDRRASYDSGVLDKERLGRLAREVVSLAAKPGYRVTYKVKDGTTVGNQILGERCWLLDSRRFSKLEKHRGPGYQIEEIERLALYLRSDGVFAQTCENSREIYLGRYEEYLESGSVSLPASEASLLRLDFEPNYYRRTEGAVTWNSDEQPSDRMKPFVHSKGDGVREILLALVGESDQALLRRRYPRLVSDSVRIAAHKGTVVRYMTQKGFGFIEPDGGGAEVFLHSNQVLPDGRGSLAAGARVAFDIKQGGKGPSAHNVSVIG